MPPSSHCVFTIIFLFINSLFKMLVEKVSKINSYACEVNQNYMNFDVTAIEIQPIILHKRQIKCTFYAVVAF